MTVEVGFFVIFVIFWSFTTVTVSFMDHTVIAVTCTFSPLITIKILYYYILLL